MKIKEAVEALLEGKTVNSANAQATLKPFVKENQNRVTVTHIKADGKEDIMDLSVSRVGMLYSKHDFALGSYKVSTPAENKAAAVTETK